MKPANLSIFESRTEWANLLFPGAFIVAFGLSRCFGIGDLIGRHYDWLDWISCVLFLNSVHVVFTLRNFWVMPEYRQLFERKKLSMPILALVFAGIFVAFLAIDRSGVSLLAKPYDIRFLVLLTFLRNFHSIRQSTGISLLYNQSLLREGCESVEATSLRALEAKARKLEHLASNSLIVGASLYAVASALPNLIPFAPQVSLSSKLLLAFSAALFLRTAFLVPHGGFKLKKGIFLLRHAPMFFQESYYMAHFYSGSKHGIEYLFFDKAMNKNSRLRRQLGLWGGLVVLLLILVKIHGDFDFRYLGMPGLPSAHVGNAIYSLAAAFAWTLTFFHYFVDSLLFRMKDPVNREVIGPLLPTGSPG